MASNKILVEILALQEIWNIPNLPSIEIPNYNFTFKKRSKFRGGGVGFYIKKGIPYKVIENLSCFHEKLFECITIEIQFGGQKILISNIYRSPSSLPNHTPNEQIKKFFEHFENLLENLSNTGTELYVMMDKTF